MSNAPIRSPSYPSMSLEDAIEAVRKIEGKYRSSGIDRESAAKLIGFSTLSGPANKALAALASFGLVERAGKSMMRVSPLARSIIHAHSDHEFRDGITQAAMSPRLFQEIKSRFPDMAIPPEPGVVNYLNREGFNPSAVRPACKAFLSTMEFLHQHDSSESAGSGSSRDGSTIPEQAVEARGTVRAPERPKRESRPGMKEDVYTLPEGDVVLQWPDMLSEESYADIEAWTKLVLRKIARHVQQPQSLRQNTTMKDEDDSLNDIPE